MTMTTHSRQHCTDEGGHVRVGGTYKDHSMHYWTLRVDSQITKVSQVETIS